MLKHIIPLIAPEHELYCEPFCGGAAVFWAKDPSPIEVINDANRQVINFYEQIQNNFEGLQNRIKATLLSRASFEDAWVMYNTPHLFDSESLAWAFWVLTQQGLFGKISKTWSFGTSNNRAEKTLRNKRAQFLSYYEERLGAVQIECNDALKVIKSRDKEHSFFYVDPPYFNSNMGHYKGYTENDFEALLKMLANIKGKFLLSSYPSELLTRYTEEYQWKTQSFTKNLAVSKGKTKVEVLTWNY